MAEIIILSPCKAMDTVSGNQTIQYSTYTDYLVRYFSGKSLHEISQFFKVSDQLAQEILTYYQHFSWNAGKTAWQTYQGLAFRQFEWDKIQKKYADQHLRILSALYGPISPTAAIYPYRLDFTRSLKIEGQTLKSLWRQTFASQFENHTIYNLASTEFASLIPKEHCHVIDVAFYQSFPNKKVLAPTAKKLRGALAANILEKQSFDETTFRNFSFEGYQLYHYDPQKGYIYYTLM